MHTRTCTHTHTCNPPGPDAAHTHTCYHTHTQVISSGEDTKAHSLSSSLKPRRPLGNREAVRKYREKKKAHTAYLEEEVRKLRLLNQQLIRKVQGQAALEAEVLRLRRVLIDLRGKIDVELSQFPFQQHCSSDTNSRLEEGDCRFPSSGGVGATGIPCQAEIPCLIPLGNGTGASKAVFSWGENCQPAVVNCRVNGNITVASNNQQLEAVGTMAANEDQGQ